MALSHDEARRYARHLLLPEIGEDGQKKLKEAAVLVIGAGGLGAASISYLAAAGIGHLGIVDHDSVELSNLNRQIIHESGDIGRRKVESAADRIGELNPETWITALPERFESYDPAELLPEYDLVLDGSDSFATRFAVAHACHTQKTPLISAAIRAFSGQLSTFKSHLGAPHPCYRCLVPELPSEEADCAVRGVVGPLVGVMGSFQALEAIKELLEIGSSLTGRLLRFDGLSGKWSESRLSRDPHCPLCS